MLSVSVTITVLLLAFCSVAVAVVNKEVNRRIDASSAVLRVHTDIKTAEVTGEYVYILKNAAAERLAYLSATVKGKEVPVSPPTMSEGYTSYVFTVPTGSPTIKVTAVFTDAVVPYPEEVTQLENQLVIVTDSHYFFSPYTTETQKTVVEHTGNGVESYTKLDPHTARAKSISFGPFTDIPAFSHSELKIHAVNNTPFAKFSTVRREVEVSHWGNIAIEEIYELVHAGAKLIGGFSRYDYISRRNVQNPSFRSLKAVLPGQATNVYYRDQIGNISTSDMLINEKEIEVVVQTRFPMFGGWKTQFYLGYSIPTELALSIDSELDKYVLKFDFFSVFSDVWVEDMEIKVILPEGAEDIQTQLPYTAEQKRTIRYTYLDSEFNGGRPVLTISASNLVEEHDKEVVITYRFPKHKMVIEPLMLVGAFFLLFVFCSVIARTQSISARGLKSKTSEKQLSDAAEKSKSD